MSTPRIAAVRRRPLWAPGIRLLRATALASLVIVPALASEATAQGRRGGELIGHLVNRQTREPIAGVRVQLVGTRVAVFTDSAGLFAMRGLPSGSAISFEARAIGYRMRTFDMTLPTGTPVEQVFELEPQILALDTVRVAAPPSTNWRSADGFEVRRRRGIGYFITQDMIEERQANTLTDILQIVPGLWASCRGGTCDVQMMASGRNCRPEYFLDGYPATNATGWDFPARTVGAVEIYRSLFEVPPEFQRSNLRCGVIAIWTRGTTGRR